MDHKVAFPPFPNYDKHTGPKQSLFPHRMQTKIGIILQKGLGNHQILCTAKSRSTHRDGLKQLLDDIEEELRPLEVNTANYFKMAGGQDLDELYTTKNHSFNDTLPSTCGLEIFRKNINQWQKAGKRMFEDEYEDNNYMEDEDNYLETLESIEEDTTCETSLTTVKDEMTMDGIKDAEIDYDSTTKIKKQSKQKIMNEEIEDDIKIYEEAAFFRKRLQEIKIKQSSVNNVEQMAKITLKKIAKIRALARHKLRRLDKARNVYLRKLKGLLNKMKGMNYY